MAIDKGIKVFSTILGIVRRQKNKKNLEKSRDSRMLEGKSLVGIHDEIIRGGVFDLKNDQELQELNSYLKYTSIRIKRWENRKCYIYDEQVDCAIVSLISTKEITKKDILNLLLLVFQNEE